MNNQEVAKANYTVYQHIAPNGKSYIGITGRDPKYRWQNGKGYRSNEYFDNAIKKYGWGNIEHKIIKTNLTKEEAEEMERELIAKFNSNDRDHGYNITSGGECIGKHSEESKRKMSEHTKGQVSPRKGVHLSEETKAKLSASHKGLRYNIGVPFTEERKKHLRENHADVRGERNPNYGKRWTPEQLAVRQAHRVYTRGAEHPQAKKICQSLPDGTVVKIWGSISEASEYYCRTSIKDVLRGKWKQHKGYIWTYYEVNENERKQNI